MLFPRTDENRALANATISRLKADARKESAKASLLRVGGYGVLVMCLGLGCGAAFLGYASIMNAQSSSNEIAERLGKGIEHTVLSVTGQIKLASGTTVSLDHNATVGLDPHASVTVKSGETVRVQDTRHSLDHTNTGRPISGANVTTSYTVLKEVKYAKGAVLTAWTFESNASATPSLQRCYYSERSPQSSASIVIELALDGQIISQVWRAPIDTTAAATNCVWFNPQGGA